MAEHWIYRNQDTGLELYIPTELTDSDELAKIKFEFLDEWQIKFFAETKGMVYRVGLKRNDEKALFVYFCTTFSIGGSMIASDKDELYMKFVNKVKRDLAEYMGAMEATSEERYHVRAVFAKPPADMREGLEEVLEKVFRAR